MRRHVLLSHAIIVTFLVACLAACQFTADSEPGTEDDARWSLPSDDAIRRLLATRMEHNGVGIVVGVVDATRRSVVAYGRTGAPDGRPLDADTLFQIGSVTKPITSLLLAEMVTRGEVGLDDPAAAYLPPDVSMPERGRPITLRDLATHRSGLPSMPSNFDLAGEPDPYEAYSVDDLWDFLSSQALEREPGQEAIYSNLGVSLLGRLLGLRMETDYETLVTDRVLAPLGMDSTSITLTKDQRDRLAPGHGPYLEPVETWEMATLQASGSLRSTANDILNLLEAYLGYQDSPLREAMALQLAGGGIHDDRPRALGWGIRDDGTVRHSGGKAGYRSAVAFHPGAGIGAVVLANARTYAPEPMHLAYHLVTGTPLPPPEPAPAPKPRIELSEAELDALTGRYRLAAGGDIDVVRNRDHLLMRYENGSIWSFAASSPTDFFLVSGNDDITFERDADGRVTGLVRFGDGRHEEAREHAERVQPSDQPGGEPTA